MTRARPTPLATAQPTCRPAQAATPVGLKVTSTSAGRSASALQRRSGRRRDDDSHGTVLLGEMPATTPTPPHSSVVASLPWARHGARHTRDFEDTVAWMAPPRARSPTPPATADDRCGAAPPSPLPPGPTSRSSRTCSGTPASCPPPTPTHRCFPKSPPTAPKPSPALVRTAAVHPPSHPNRRGVAALRQANNRRRPDPRPRPTLPPAPGAKEYLTGNTYRSGRVGCRGIEPRTRGLKADYSAAGLARPVSPGAVWAGQLAGAVSACPAGVTSCWLVRRPQCWPRAGCCRPVPTGARPAVPATAAGCRTVPRAAVRLVPAAAGPCQRVRRHRPGAAGCAVTELAHPQALNVGHAPSLPATAGDEHGAELSVEQRFAVVPEWLLDSTVSDTAFRLYAVLARYGNTSGVRMPGRALLARRMRRSLDTVERRIEAGRNLTNRYHLRTLDPAADTNTSASAETAGVLPIRQGDGRTDAATLSADLHTAGCGGRTDAATPGRVDAATGGRTGAATGSRRAAAQPRDSYRDTTTTHAREHGSPNRQLPQPAWRQYSSASGPGPAGRPGRSGPRRVGAGVGALVRAVPRDRPAVRRRRPWLARPARRHS